MFNTSNTTSHTKTAPGSRRAKPSAAAASTAPNRNNSAKKNGKTTSLPLKAKRSFDKSLAKKDSKRKASARKRTRRAFENVPITLTYCLNDPEIPPWLVQHGCATAVLNTMDRHVSLHFELLQFARFAAATPSERAARDSLIARVSRIARSLWPASSVEVFGSYRNGLGLPGCDVDLVVQGIPGFRNHRDLKQFSKAIRANYFADMVTVIYARVSLVKFVARNGTVPCDVSFGQQNGIDCLPLVAGFVKSYPPLVPLLLTVKAYLKQLSLHDPAFGGIGSYTLFNMVLSHLQMLHCNFPDVISAEGELPNLGVLLELFFHLYGRMYNPILTGMQTKDGGTYFEQLVRFPKDADRILRYSVEDPNDETNELGRGSSKAPRIREAFCAASNALKAWQWGDESCSLSPLGMILDPSVFRKRRAEVVKGFAERGEDPASDLEQLKKDCGLVFEKYDGNANASALRPAGGTLHEDEIEKVDTAHGVTGQRKHVKGNKSVLKSGAIAAANEVIDVDKLSNGRESPLKQICDLTLDNESDVQEKTSNAQRLT